MTSRIASVTGRQLWDSRGRPTVEAEVVLESGAVGRKRGHHHRASRDRLGRGAIEGRQLHPL